MAKNIASIKQTAGVGFSFEDKVLAYFLIHLLKGSSPFFPTTGNIQEISLQTRPLGWLLDDILITTRSNTSSFKFAFSIKSNKQITRSGFPKDFVTTCWEQYLSKEIKDNDESHNYYGLITSPIALDVKTNLDEVLNWSRYKNFELIKEYIEKSNPIKKNIYSSLRCPENVREINIPPMDQIPILARIIHIEFDFLFSISKHEREAIELCQSILKNDDPNDRILFWEHLVSLSSSYRAYSANINRQRLLADLNNNFILNENPLFEIDYKKIKNYTALKLNTIRDVIGVNYKFKRENESQTLNLKINNSAFIVLLGRSGSGKTALIKNWILPILDKKNIFLLNATSFEEKEFSSFEKIFNFSHSLEEIAKSVSNFSYLIIDGVDRIYSINALNNLTQLLRIILSSNHNNLWKIILSCQTDEWNRILERLSLDFPGLNVSKYELLDSQIQKYLDIILSEFAQLTYIKRNKKLCEVLKNFKILDLIVSKTEHLSESATAKWVGESDIIEWFWNEIVATPLKKYLRGKILKNIAINQADLLVQGIPLSKFDSGELSEIEILEQENLCFIYDEKITFYHDLFSEWVLMKVLIEQSDNLKNFLIDRVTSPLWIKAVRLYGIYLLEQKSVNEWKSLLDESVDKNLTIISDTLLESIFFSKTSLIILHEIKNMLNENHGNLLRRMLIKFLFICTHPNPIYLNFLEHDDPSQIRIASTIERIPNSIYWLAMLKYLYNNKEEISNYAPFQLAQICLKWLKFTPIDYPLRKEASEMAVELAEKEFALHNSKIFYYDKSGVTKLAYRASLYAIQEYPERVRELALTASCRMQIMEPISTEIKKINSKVETIKTNTNSETDLHVLPSIVTLKKELQPPWPFGPFKRVDKDFQEVCLDNDALEPIINTMPDLAREILLALLIKEPSSIDHFNRTLFSDLEIEYNHKWCPPMYFRGPFLLFLRRQPKIALQAIIELVNFATERWKSERPDYDFGLCINYNSQNLILIGNEQVFYWSKEGGNAPHPIVSALMAVEKFLYEQIEQSKNIEHFIKQIIESSNSLAFYGLMISVGLKHLELFKNILKFILLVPEFHFWEYSYSFQPKEYLMWGWELEPKSFQKVAYEWHNLPHRKLDLTYLSKHFALNDPDFETTFQKIKKEWALYMKDFSEQSQFRIFLENWIEIYNKRNYKLVKDVNNNFWQFKEPRELRTSNRKRRRKIEDNKFLLQYPVMCRQILSGKYKIDDSYFKYMIDSLKRIDKINIKEDQKISKANALCGAIAVLFIKFRKELHRLIEVEKWCTKKIVDVNMHSKNFEYSTFSSEVDIYDMRWDSFSAEVLPIIWSENPDSIQIRECIANIAVTKYYKTIEILFTAASKRREYLGQNWYKLRNFILFHSVIRGKFSWYEKELLDYRELTKLLQEYFIKDNICSVFISLKNICDKIPNEIYSNIKGIKDHCFIDTQLIQSAHSWMLYDGFWSDKDEILYFVQIWDDFIDYTLEKIKRNHKDEDSHMSYPDCWDKWVFDFLPVLITKINNETMVKKYWLSIIELGIPYHNYINDFLRGWFINYLRHVERKTENEIRNNFVSEWKKMIDLYINYYTWEPNFKGRWYYIEEMASSIMGFENMLFDFWDESLVSLVNEMKDYYNLWFDKYSIHSQCVRDFINFLRQPASQPIIFEGIIWLQDSYEKYYLGWDEEDIIEPLANLLNELWTKRELQVRKNNNCFEGFKRLLNKLVEKQNPIALVLHHQISLG